MEGRRRSIGRVKKKGSKMCSSSEREKERKREQSAKKLEEREKERERGVKPRHPHPMGHPPLKKELILIRFFI